MSFIADLGDWLRKIANSVSNISINGRNLTITKHNGTTQTLQTQDTTYDLSNYATTNDLSNYAIKTGQLSSNPITRTSPANNQFSMLESAPEVCDIGWEYNQSMGAVLGLRSKDHTESGVFVLIAKNSAKEAFLTGRPDGTLEWNGSSLIYNGTFTKMFFSQTSGTYTAPYTGIYRISLKGGGGGGGGFNKNQYRLGAGGGEGGLLTFYIQLTKGQSYPYVIGAGGNAGTNNTTNPTAGGNGGSSSFNSAYSVAGGNGGDRGSTAATGYGGAGGRTYTAPTGSVVHFTPGISGDSNIYGDQSGSKWLQYGVKGGGHGGSSQQNTAGIYGGGGCGTCESGYGSTFYNATAGGAGYILIEYMG